MASTSNVQPPSPRLQPQPPWPASSWHLGASLHDSEPTGDQPAAVALDISLGDITEIGGPVSPPTCGATTMVGEGSTAGLQTRPISPPVSPIGGTMEELPSAVAGDTVMGTPAPAAEDREFAQSASVGVARRLPFRDDEANLCSPSPDVMPATQGANLLDLDGTPVRPPAGVGALFKCSICDGLVYESQLDYHVTVCPEDCSAQSRQQTKETHVDIDLQASEPAASGAAQLLQQPDQGTAAPLESVIEIHAEPQLAANSARRSMVHGASAAVLPATAQKPSVSQLAMHMSGQSAGFLGPPARPKSAGSSTQQRRNASSAAAPSHSSTCTGAASNELRSTRGGSPQPRQQRRPASAERAGFRGRRQREETRLDTGRQSDNLGAAGFGGGGHREAVRESLSLYQQQIGQTPRGWKEWLDNQYEAQERTRQRRKQLEEELAEREIQECTFAPQLIKRRASSSGPCHRRRSAPADPSPPRGSTRSPSPGLDGRSAPYASTPQQLARQRKLERVEAEMNAELTHHPQISPFAHAWSMRERELANQVDGQAPLPVYERLYQIAIQAREEREAAREAREGSSSQLGFGSSTPRTTGGDSINENSISRSSSSGVRRIPAYLMMYSDALDRRARRQSMEEQIAEHENAERRAACGVLERSRRYYWQMLERQIKIAFDACSGGSDTLTYPALEDFLLHFGVLRPPKSQTHLAIERAAEESRRLRVALWRHLDPEKNGYVDFLTLTVFFHVLMGAVDEEAQCLHNLSAVQARQLEEETSIAAAATAATNTGGLNSRAKVTLSAIVEEAPGAAEDFIPPSASPGAAAAAAASAAAAAADPEGKRICELLMRFDARQLRAEFHQLYLDRMHYCRHHYQQREAEEQARQPALNAQSRVLAERVVHRQREDAGDAVQSHAELMHWRHAQYEARKEEKRALKEVEEVRDCTFQPELIAASPPRMHRRALSAERSPGAPYNRLYNDSNARQRLREARAAEVENVRNAQELATCTFKPDLKKSVRSYCRQPVTTPLPRGFDESKQRMRRAFAGQVEKRRFLDDRFFRLSPGEKPGVPPEDRLNTSRSSSIAHIAAAAQSAASLSANFPAVEPIYDLLRGGSTVSVGATEHMPQQWSPGVQPLPGQSSFLPVGEPAPSPRSQQFLAEQTALLTQDASHSRYGELDSMQHAHLHSQHLLSGGQHSWCGTAGNEATDATCANYGNGVTGIGATFMEEHPSVASSATTIRPTRTSSTAGGSGAAPASSSQAPSTQIASPRGARAPTAGAMGGGAQRQAPQGAGRDKPGIRGRPKSAEGSSVKIGATTSGRGSAGLAKSRVGIKERASVLPSQAGGVAQAERAGLEEESMRPPQPPLVYVEVNIAPGRPPERLTLRHGQSPAEAAADFAVQHRLAPALAQRLHVMLQDLLSKPEGVP